MDSLTPQVQSQAVQALPPFLPDSFNITATTIVIIWNAFLTLDEEVEFIWSSNMTFVKILYFVVRYLAILLFCGATFGFFVDINTNLCPAVIWFVPISGSIVIACSNILLLIRVYVFYGRSKYIFWTLCSGYVLGEILMTGFLISGLPNFRAAKDNFPSPIPELFGSCIFKSYPRIFGDVWFLNLTFEAIAFICIVTKFAQVQFAAWNTGLSNSQLHNVFLRDGTWAFFVLFLLFLSTGILLHVHDPAGLSTALWAWCLSSICSTRLILNLHHAAKEIQYSGDPSPRVTVTIEVEVH